MTSQSQSSHPPCSCQRWPARGLGQHGKPQQGQTARAHVMHATDGRTAECKSREELGRVAEREAWGEGQKRQESESGASKRERARPRLKRTTWPITESKTLWPRHQVAVVLRSHLIMPTVQTEASGNKLRQQSPGLADAWIPVKSALGQPARTQLGWHSGAWQYTCNTRWLLGHNSYSWVHSPQQPNRASGLAELCKGLSHSSTRRTKASTAEV